MVQHDDAIEFPNGEGFTPCSSQYARLCDQLEAIKPNDASLDDLSPADYNLWNELNDQCSRLMLEGHLGKSIRY
jgi:hypothetical protein